MREGEEFFSPDYLDFRAANDDEATEKANKKLMRHYQKQVESLKAYRWLRFILSDQQAAKDHSRPWGFDVDQYGRWWALEADALFATQAHPDGVREAGA
jgi:hypothetical protein